ncbi:hypothetical protein [Mixta theicola]|nr:hypothetical protein [Mixta theicola]
MTRGQMLGYFIFGYAAGLFGAGFAANKVADCYGCR